MNKVTVKQMDSRLLLLDSLPRGDQMRKREKQFSANGRPSLIFQHNVENPELGRCAIEAGPM